MTTSPVRRTLEELKTNYLLYPEYREVFVEGRIDARVLKWFLSENGLTDVQVFAVDDRVDVPSEVVCAVHPEVNARGRVVALAQTSAAWGLSGPSITCIIDADFDCLDNPNYGACATLLCTDYSAMEVYVLKERPLTKLLGQVADPGTLANQVVATLTPAWRRLYALRYVAHRHSDELSPPKSFAKRCIQQNGELRSVSEMIRTFSPSPTQDEVERLSRIFDATIKNLPKHPLQGIRGHDIAPLLISFLGLTNEFAKDEVIEALMRQSMELRDFMEENLFERLILRLKADSTD